MNIKKLMMCLSLGLIGATSLNVKDTTNANSTTDVQPVVSSVSGEKENNTPNTTEINKPVKKNGATSTIGRTSTLSATLPNGATSWEDVYTFDSTSGLITGIKSAYSSVTAIEIPDSIGGVVVQGFANGTDTTTSPFVNNTQITSVTFPTIVSASDLDNYLAPNMFQGCSNLTTVTLPTNITKLPNNCFLSCTKLTNVTLPISLTMIGAAAFAGTTALKTLTLPNTLENIGSWCFSQSGITSIDIPDSVTEIWGNAFRLTRSLKTININTTSKLTLLGLGTFNGSAVEHLYVPSKVTTMAGAFAGAYDLKSIEFASDINVNFTDSSSTTSTEILHKDGTSSTQDANLIGCFQDCASLTSIDIPSSVDTLGGQCFQRCTSLTQIDIPSNVRGIYGSAFNTSGLTSITIPATVTQGMGTHVFAGCKSLKTVEIKAPITKIDNSVFVNCNSLTSITIPNTVTSIGNNSFQNCTSLQSIVLPNELVSIGSYTFNNCTALQNILLPDSVTTIGAYSFAGCSKLTTFTISTNSQLKTIGTLAFMQTAITSLYIPSTVTALTAAFAAMQALQTITFGEGINVNFANSTNTTTTRVYAAEVSEDIALNEIGLFYRCSALKSIVVPDGVATIDTNCFAYTTALTTVELPSSVNFIGTSAFKSSGVTSINLEDTDITIINQETFYLANKLTSITIPNSVISTEANAFNGCTSLTTLNFEANSELKTIGYSAFMRCLSLTSVVLPDSVVTIYGYAFNGCSNLYNLQLSNSLVTIEQGSFNNCSKIPSVVLPNSVTTIGNQAFGNCSRLTSFTINIGSQLSKIGYAAFTNAKITELYLPSTISEISGAFANMPNLTTVTFAEDAQVDFDTLGSTDQVTLYYSDGSNETLNLYALGTFYKCTSLTTINIPSSVTTIGTNCFHRCTSLDNITLPNGLTQIGNQAFNFAGITSINIPNTVTKIDTSAFAACDKLVSVTFEAGSTLTTIGATAFGWCYKLAEFTLPDSVTTIGNRAFVLDYELATFNISTNSNLTSIGLLAFNGSAIKSLYIPSGVTTITAAFAGMGSLETIEFASDINVDFANSSETSTISYRSPITKTESSVVLNTIGLFMDDIALKSIIVPNSVTKLGYYCFQNCSALTDVTLNEGLTLIQGAAFYGCSTLASIEIPDAVTNIGNNAFAHCTALTTVTISSSSQLTSTGNHAFTHCEVLTSITLPNTLTTLGTNVFYNCYELANVTLSNQLTSIPHDTFFSCKALNNVIIPASVTSIGNSAFNGCSGLTTLTFAEGSTLTTISDNAFISSHLTSFALPDSVTTIGNSAFKWTMYLETFTINPTSKLQSVGFLAFNRSKIGSLYLPSTITNIQGAFAGMAYLTEVTFAEGAQVNFDNTTDETTENFVYADGTTEVVKRSDIGVFEECPLLASINIPASVTVLGAGCFDDNKALDNVTIPSGVTSIEGHAFFRCTSLSSINIPASVVTIGGYAFNGCSKMTKVEFEGGSKLTAIGNSGFAWCYALTEFTLPDSVTTLGNFAFGYTYGLTSFNISTSSKLQSIGPLCFNYSAVEDMYIPVGVTSMQAAFTGAFGLTTIEFAEGINVNFDNPSSSLGSTTVYLKSGNKTMEYSLMGMFYECTNLKSIVIPASVTVIDSYCFYKCTSLESVEFESNNTLQKIRYEAFAWCESLPTITLPTSLVELQNSFHTCSSLTYVNIPAGVPQIVDCTFQNCYKLATVEVDPNSILKAIGQKAFCNSGITSIYLPSTLQMINTSAFENCTALTTVTLANNMGTTTIADKAFYNTTVLEGIALENCANLTALGVSAFENSGIRSIIIPGSLSKINGRVFYNCDRLVTVELQDGVQVISYNAFNECSELTTFTMPNTVVTIEQGVFFGTNKLGDITLSTNLTTLGAQAFYYSGVTSINLQDTKLTVIESDTFNKTTRLSCEITIPNTVTTIKSNAFLGSAITGLAFADGSVCSQINSYAFNACTGLVSVSLPASLTYLGRGAFYGTTALETCTFADGTAISTFDEKVFCYSGLKSITLPMGVTRIPNATFYGCTMLTSVQALDTITMFNDPTASDETLFGAFYNCTALIDVFDTSSVTYFPKYSFYNCSSLTSTLDFTNATIIETYAFYGCANMGANLSNANKLIYVRDYAFQGCQNLNTDFVSTSGTLITLGRSAFESSGIKAINLSMATSGVVGMRAFYNAYGVTTVDIGGGCVSIGQECFQGCNTISQAFVGAKVTSLGSSCFYGNPLGDGITFEAGSQLNTIGVYCFAGCRQLQSIELPAGITTLPMAAFASCSELTTVTSLGTITDIQDGSNSTNGVFYNCTKLSTIFDLSQATRIGAYAFYNTTALSITPDFSNLTTLGTYAFYKSGITGEISLPKVAVISNFAFNYSKITGLVAPVLTKIGNTSFDNCTSLTSINLNFLEGGIIDTCGFNLCSSLSSATITGDLVKLNGWTFSGCGALKSFTLPATVTSISSHEFSYANLSEGFTFESGSKLTEIGVGMFYQSKLKTITLPDSIRTIGNGAFFQISELTTINANWAEITSIGTNAFDSCKVWSADISLDKISTIGSSAFINCSGLTLRIGGNLTTITTSAFRNVKKVVLLSGTSTNATGEIVTFTLDATNDPTYLPNTTIYVPREDYNEYVTNYSTINFVPYGLRVNFVNNGGSGVDYIDIPLNTLLTGEAIPVTYEPVFAGHQFAGWYTNESLTGSENLYVPTVLTHDITLYAAWRTDDENMWLTAFTFTIDGSNATITGLKEENVGLSTVLIPQFVQDDEGNYYTVTSIGSSAFYNNTHIISMIFDSNSEVTTIGDFAFSGTSSLTTLTLPSALSTLGSRTVSGCNNLRDVTISGNANFSVVNGMLMQGTKVVLVPNGLTTFEIPGNATSIGSYAFDNITNVTQIDLGMVINVEQYAFYGVSNLISFTMRTPHTTMADNAFVGCYNLRTILSAGRKSGAIIPTITNLSLPENLRGVITVYVHTDDLLIYQSSNWTLYNLSTYDGEANTTYLVNLNYNDGANNNIQFIVVEGGRIPAIINPSKLGYVFHGWQIMDGATATGEYFDVVNSLVTSNLSLSAHFVVNQYIINYYLNGGMYNDVVYTDEAFTQEYTIESFGANLDTPVSVITPTMVGYTFVGWYTKPDFDSAKVTAINFDDLTYSQIQGNSSVTLYAKWEIITFTVDIVEGTGFDIGEVSGYTNPVKYNENFKFMITFETGYTQNNSENIVVTAYAEGSDEGVVIDATVEEGIIYYEMANLLTNYRVEITGVNVNIYNVYFRDGSKGYSTVTNMQSAITVNHSEDVASRITPSSPEANGYEFAGWKLVQIVDGEEKVGPDYFDFSTPIEAETILVADWNMVYYTITYDLNGAFVGSSTDTTLTAYYTIEDTIILPTARDLSYNVNYAGHTFLGWNNADESNDDYITSFRSGNTGDITYVADWELVTYHIYYETNNGSLADGYPTTFTVNNEITLPTPSYLGHTFKAWYLNSSLTGNTITSFKGSDMLADVNVYAAYESNTYTITYHLNGSDVAPCSVGGIIIPANINTYSGSYGYTTESDYTLVSDLTREGYTFAGWYTTADFSGDKITNIQAGITGDVEYYAKWTGKEYNILLNYGSEFVGTPEIGALNFTFADFTEENNNTITLPVPTTEGHFFVGWYDGNGNLVQSITPSNCESITTLTARWSTNSYTIDVTGANISAIRLLGDKGELTAVYGGTIKFVVDFVDTSYNRSTLTVSYTMGGTTESLTADSNGYYTITNISGDLTINIDGIELNKYSITFISNLGTSINTIEGITHGQTATKPADPTREGYDFSGWYSDISLFSPYNWDSAVTYDLTLYAGWTLQTYDITFSNNINNDTLTDTYTVANPVVFADIQEFSIDGYKFLGWYIDGTKVTSTTGRTGNLEVEAIYEAISYTITYSIDNGTNSPSNSSTTYTINDEVLLYPASKEGYDFVNWVVENADFDGTLSTDGLPNGVVAKIIKGSIGNLVLTANFKLQTENYYQVTFMIDGLTYGKISASKETGELTQDITNPTKAGYTFDGWYVDDTKFDFNTQSISRDMVVVAQFSIEEYTITYNLDVWTSATHSNPNTINVNDVVTLSPAVLNGYTFTGWYLGGELVQTLTNISEDITLTAVFDLNTYTITYVTMGGTHSNAVTEYNVNDANITLVDAYKEGYTFTGWTTPDSSVVITEINTNDAKDITLIANFELIETTHYEINYYFRNINTNTTTLLNKVAFEQGTVPTEYTPSDMVGYTFAGWYTDANLENEYVLDELTSSINLFGKFEYVDYTVEYDFGDLTGVTNATNPTTINIDSVVSLSNPTRAGYTFAGWYMDSEYANAITILSSSNIDTLADNDKNITLYAKFEVINYTITYAIDSGTNSSVNLNNLTYTINDEIMIYGAVKSGFRFLSWEISNQGEFNGLLSTEDLESGAVVKLVKGSTGNLVLTANFQLLSDDFYGITFMVGDMIYTQRSVEKNEVFTDMVEYDVDGYEFVGWFEQDALLAFDFSQSITESITLHAKLQAIDYRITYNLGEWYQAQHSNDNFITVEDVYVLNDATLNGYKFLGWFTDNTYETQVKVLSGVAEDVDLYAKFEVIEYTITYAIDNGSNLNTITTYTVNDEVMIYRAVKDGYEFLGWSAVGAELSTEGLTGDAVAKISQGTTGNIVLTANFRLMSENFYQLTFIVDGLTYKTASVVKSGLYSYPDQLSRTGYTFLGWYKSGSVAPFNFSETIITEDTTFTAQFEVINYTIEYDYGSLTDVVNNNPTVTTVERVLSLGSASRLGYTFVGWYSDSEYVNPVTTLSRENISLADADNKITLYAKFDVINYKITWSIDNGTNNQSNTQWTSYTVNDFVMIYPASKTGYDFAGWSIVGGTLSTDQMSLAGGAVAYIARGSTGDVVLTAHFTLISDRYSEIKFVYDSKTYDAISVPTGSIYSEAPVLTKDGYNFLGWYVDGSQSAFDWTQSIDNNLVVTAKFEIITYTIEYDYQGLTVSNNNPTEITVQNIVTLEDLSLNGYTFDGWYTEISHVNQIKTLSADNIVNLANSSNKIVLYAKLNRITYNITYITDGGTHPNQLTFNVTQNAIVLENAVKEGYLFKGWTEVDGTPITEIDTQIARDITIIAKWEIIETLYCDVKFYFRNIVSNTTTLLNREAIIKNETLSPYTPDEFEGFTFVGWYTDKELTIPYDYGAVTEDLEIYGKYVYDNYYITYVTNVTNITNTNPIAVTIDDVVTLTDGVKNGYTFAGWYTDSEYSIKVTELKNVSNDITLYGKFEINTYTITYVTNGGVHDNVTEYTVLDSNITLKDATDKTDYKFLGWVTPDGAPITIINTSYAYDITVIAEWELIVYENYEVSYYFRNNNTLLDKVAVREGRIPTEYQAPAVDGYKFEGWFYDDGYTRPYTASAIYQNTNIYGKYSLVSSVISYSMPQGATQSNASTITCEDVITLTPATLRGYEFEGWYTDTNYQNQVTSLSNITSDITLYGKFEIVTYNITYINNGGTHSNTTTYTIDDATIFLLDPTREGYNFTGWTYSNGENAQNYIDPSIATDLTLVANWSIIEEVYYEVKYYFRNTATNITTLLNVISIEKDDILSVYVPDEFVGYTFVGWYTNAELTNAYQYNKVTSNLELYGRFDYINYDVAYHFNVDGNITNNNLTSVNVDSLLVLEDPSIEGYDFIGWYIGDTKVSVLNNITNNLNITGKFVAHTYTITYYDGAQEIATANPSSYDITTSAIELGAVDKLGYTFTGWTDINGNRITNIDEGSVGNIKLYANYTINTYSVNYEFVVEETGNQPINTVTNNLNVNSATILSNSYLREASARGYTFLGWYVGDTQITSIESVTEDMLITGKFSLNTYTITYDVDDKVTHSNPTTYTVEDDDFALTDAVGATEFWGWQEGKRMITTIDTARAQDIILTATFAPVIEESADTNTVTYVAIGAGAIMAGTIATLSILLSKARKRTKVDGERMIQLLNELNNRKHGSNNANSNYSTGNTNSRRREDDDDLQI